MFKGVFLTIKRIGYLFLVAWMLGISNVILEETRLVNDTRLSIEQDEVATDTDLNDNEVFKL
ncbi:MAG: hypothetical protein HKO92_10560 [Flavobacteriaceae bacterium]|nr:hypothetical protein [Flavobacteriaceae bacterium]